MRNLFLAACRVAPTNPHHTNWREHSERSVKRRVQWLQDRRALSGLRRSRQGRKPFAVTLAADALAGIGYYGGERVEFFYHDEAGGIEPGDLVALRVQGERRAAVGLAFVEWEGGEPRVALHRAHPKARTPIHDRERVSVLGVLPRHIAPEGDEYGAWFARRR